MSLGDLHLTVAVVSKIQRPATIVVIASFDTIRRAALGPHLWAETEDFGQCRWNATLGVGRRRIKCCLPETQINECCVLTTHFRECRIAVKLLAVDVYAIL